ncbi:grpE protein homolog 2, mitochondrial-like isoform X1 [Typha latifolia]|uniref:grpE protein homolog 2, mitochondrial-like isoform X1 n=1 Tax=Typha latifolia TaxID=4733 RepID=UPI003C2E96FC
MASRVLSRISRRSVGHCLTSASPRPESLKILSSGFRSLAGSASCSYTKHQVPFQSNQMLRHSTLANAILRTFGFSSSASSEATEKEVKQSADKADAAKAVPKNATDAGSTKSMNDSTGAEQAPDADSDTEDELSMDDLVKLVSEKEELLKVKHKEIEKMQDKVLRSYAEMENVIDRTKREAENSKKYAVQNFAKSLLDVADNLGRASSVVKESFSKVDVSKDSAGAVPLLKTLLEGVRMTEKQLSEVFGKFGVEKFDPVNEHFDPHRHHALFQIPDGSKPAGTVAVVLKNGYMLYDRVLRPAEVGVTEALNDETNQSSSA